MLENNEMVMILQTCSLVSNEINTLARNPAAILLAASVVAGRVWTMLVNRTDSQSSAARFVGWRLLSTNFPLN
jgi:hypothetical protein